MQGQQLPLVQTPHNKHNINFQTPYQTKTHEPDTIAIWFVYCIHFAKWPVN